VAITAPEGCILNCRPPAPVAARHIVGQWLPSVVHGALYQAVPDRVLAEGASNLWITQFNGTWRPAPSGRPSEPRDRSEGSAAPQRFSLLFFNSGGMGARPTKDGLSSTAFPSGVQGTPAEIVEARSPLMIHRRELRTDSGGPGQYRGGLGHWLEISAPRAAGPYRFSPFFDRTVYPARGLGGGLPGATGVYWLEKPDGTREAPNPKATVFVDPTTRIVIGLPGGAGVGDPKSRDPESIHQDLTNGLVSPDSAARDYGAETSDL
jgi:N-methylhydantoinase B/oxoprolinase/acetone carboxylase alpha subunit